jgi:hypothetical protein
MLPFEYRSLDGCSSGNFKGAETAHGKQQQQTEEQKTSGYIVVTNLFIPALRGCATQSLIVF